VQTALAYWLNREVLKQSVVVEAVKQRSAKAKPPNVFELVVRPVTPEEQEGACASSSPAANA
jgi:hypothetical protein